MWKLTAKSARLDVLPFGMHKGRPFAEVPTDYLLWLWRRSNLRPPLREVVGRQLRARYSLERLVRLLRAQGFQGELP